MTDKEQLKNNTELSLTMNQFSELYPFAFEVYMRGGRVYFAIQNDGEQMAIYFDTKRGCYVTERPGKQPKMIMDALGRPCRTLQQLSERLKGMKVMRLDRGQESELE